MNYGNIPQYSVLPQFYLPTGAILWFRLAVVVFAAFFFISLHWRIHVMQHGFPPMYILRVSEWLGKLWKRGGLDSVQALSHKKKPPQRVLMRRGGDIAVSFARISDGLDQHLDPLIVPVNPSQQNYPAVMPAIHSP